ASLCDALLANTGAEAVQAAVDGKSLCLRLGPYSSQQHPSGCMRLYQSSADASSGRYTLRPIYHLLLRRNDFLTRFLDCYAPWTMAHRLRHKPSRVSTPGCMRRTHPAKAHPAVRDAESCRRQPAVARAMLSAHESLLAGAAARSSSGGRER
ncbi:hypothetical protein CVT26_007661, partial [Gymnopilus dilepis]